MSILNNYTLSEKWIAIPADGSFPWRILCLFPTALLSRKLQAYTDIQWFPILKIPKLGYDHNEIAETAFERLKAKLEYTNIICNLLSMEFTLPELQKIYEIILGKKFDKRNFRKKILQTKLLKKSPNKTI